MGSDQSWTNPTAETRLVDLSRPETGDERTNPKDVEALKTGKIPLDYLEPAGDEAGALALKFGADKYGVRNYIESPISARVYVAAMRRHLSDWLRGEDDAPDSGVHHLGHIIANCHVALAAIEAGSFIDDRHGEEWGPDRV
jgi:hypothetical protein